ncbi:hypothetical protein [uncultured Kriegella sp.]|uniref:hypothetical protein n=1 Tax=uncultured Kriegella sp. TaxID=1798910 RepID=UPI0030DDD892|tara:strand:- start:41558 stop:41935 length:378 start_codon:yes stop_codon:yes gene_type:complete
MKKLEDSKKLQNLLEALGLTANALSVKLNYKSHASIYHVLDGKASISQGMINRIVKSYPNVSYDYLVHGRLPILLDEHGTISQANKLNIPIQTDTDVFKIKRILDIPDQLDRIEMKLDELLGGNR